MSASLRGVLAASVGPLLPGPTRSVPYGTADRIAVAYTGKWCSSARRLIVMFRLVAAGVAATSLGVMVGIAVIAINGEPLSEPAVSASLSFARPSDPPNSSSASSTEAAPEPRTIVASPHVPAPAVPPAEPAAVPKPAPPAPAVTPSALPAPRTPAAHLRQQSGDDDDDDDGEDDC